MLADFDEPKYVGPERRSRLSRTSDWLASSGLSRFILAMVILSFIFAILNAGNDRGQDKELRAAAVASCLSGNDSRLRDQDRLESDVAEARTKALLEHDPEMAEAWRVTQHRKEGELARLIADVAAGGYAVEPGSVERDCEAFVDQSER